MATAAADGSLLREGLLFPSNEAIVEESGRPALQVLNATQAAVEDFPSDAQYLLANRYCEVDSVTSSITRDREANPIRSGHGSRKKNDRSGPMSTTVVEHSSF
ncbi:hypothetical protein [Schlesneria sp. T3-172]|uniref:hypothetical protein n=1 Tax=Schlesneria sphaerica TaxID=3373610 RepID=UPI0037C5298A